MHTPQTKNNYLGLMGLAGYLFANNYSPEKIAGRLSFTWNEWRIVSKDIFGVTYSERCNAQDYFIQSIKNETDFALFLDQVKSGKNDFPFSNKRHERLFCLIAS